MSMYIEYKKKLTTNFRVEEDLRRKVKKKSHSRTVFKIASTHEWLPDLCYPKELHK